MHERPLNRTQAIVLWFFALVWVALVVILAVAPDVYDRQLRLPPEASGLARLAFFAAISAFLAVLTAARRRR